MELCKILRDAGIVGAGGAGFPSYAKLAEGANTLLINGAECEPLLYTDYSILKYEMERVIAGATGILEKGGIARAILAIKEHTAKRLGLLDGDSLGRRISVKVLPNVYPMGDEVSLIYQATGRVVRPGKLPLSVGVIVFNVETVYNLAMALMGKPVTEKWLTVGGDIERTCVIKAPIGARVADVLNKLGITVNEDQAVIDGGPSMGKIVDYTTATVTKTTKGLLILPVGCEAVTSKKINTKMALSRAETACCQCTRCTDLCPRYLMGYPLYPHKMVRTAMGAVSVTPEMVKAATLCCNCGICESLACSQGISAKAVINNYKTILAKNKMRYEADGDVTPQKERDYRQIPTERWASALGVSRFDKLPLGVEEIEISRIVINPANHIGAKADIVCREGQRVSRGEVIAKAQDGLSVNYHAPFDGVVREALNKIIISKVDRDV